MKKKGVKQAPKDSQGRPIGRPSGAWLGPEYDELRSWFGTNVKRLRERRGLTQTQLGQAMSPHYAKSAIIRIESGGSSPILCRATQFAKVLGTTLDALQQHPDKLDLAAWDRTSQGGETNEAQLLRILELMHNETVRKDILELLTNKGLRGKLAAVAETIWNG